MGVVVSGLQPTRQAGDFGLTDFFFFLVACANAPEPRISTRQAQSSAARPREKMARRERVLARLAGRGVGIFAERGGISVGEDFHHPAIEVIDRVVHDGSESTIVFSMGFLNVVFQSDADISVFAAQFNLFRT